MERAAGVEPASLAWEAKVIPIYDARIIKSLPERSHLMQWEWCDFCYEVDILPTCPANILYSG